MYIYICYINLTCKKTDHLLEHNFLGLIIKISDNKFTLGLYDKRDSLPFFIVRML